MHPPYNLFQPRSTNASKYLVCSPPTTIHDSTPLRKPHCRVYNRPSRRISPPHSCSRLEQPENPRIDRDLPRRSVHPRQRHTKYLSSTNQPKRTSVDRSRCVVASACQGAASHIDRPDEPLSITTAFLIAGSPAVIGCLWNVQDVPASPLDPILRVHPGDKDEPAMALYKAQKWSRELSRKGDEAFFARHVGMLEMFLDTLSGRDTLCMGMRPFTDPMFWASWVCVGA